MRLTLESVLPFTISRIVITKKSARGTKVPNR